MSPDDRCLPHPVRDPPFPGGNAYQSHRDGNRAKNAARINWGVEIHSSSLGWTRDLFRYRLLSGRTLLQRRYHLVFLLSLQLLPSESRFGSLNIAFRLCLIFVSLSSEPPAMGRMPGGQQRFRGRRVRPVFGDGVFLVSKCHRFVLVHRGTSGDQMVDVSMPSTCLVGRLPLHDAGDPVLRQG